MTLRAEYPAESNKNAGIFVDSLTSGISLVRGYCATQIKKWSHQCVLQTCPPNILLNDGSVTISLHF